MQPGTILVRQRGTKFHVGNNVKMGRDHTIYSVIEGKVQFERLDKKRPEDQRLPKICLKPDKTVTITLYSEF